jgi:DNA-binding NarL/FixJ family response regulator
MRTLTTVALKELSSGSGIGIPRLWLEAVKSKTTSYAKNQSLFLTEHNVNRDDKVLTAREQDILHDLYHGFSQIEIANKRSLSVNTVKMYTKNLYNKLQVHKIADLIRIAAEQGLV